MNCVISAVDTTNLELPFDKIGCRANGEYGILFNLGRITIRVLLIALTLSFVAPTLVPLPVPAIMHLTVFPMGLAAVIVPLIAGLVVAEEEAAFSFEQVPSA